MARNNRKSFRSFRALDVTCPRFKRQTRIVSSRLVSSSSCPFSYLLSPLFPPHSTHFVSSSLLFSGLFLAVFCVRISSFIYCQNGNNNNKPNWFRLNKVYQCLLAGRLEMRDKQRIKLTCGREREKKHILNSVEVEPVWAACSLPSALPLRRLLSLIAGLTQVLASLYVLSWRQIQILPRLSSQLLATFYSFSALSLRAS